MHIHKEDHNTANPDSINERVYNRGIDRLRSPERVERLEVERVVDLCTDKKIKSVLDIGTGSALFAEAFSNRGLKATGIDRNPEMVEAARKYVPEGHFEEALVENIPFPDNSFDITFFGVVFHEVDDYSQALKEAYRVTVRGTYILEWNYKQEEYGPPLEHRLKSEFIKELALRTGYSSCNEIKLKNLILYKLEK